MPWVLCLARFPWLFWLCMALFGYVWRSVCGRSGCLFALPACRGFLRVQVARVRSLAVAAFGRSDRLQVFRLWFFRSCGSCVRLVAVRVSVLMPCGFSSDAVIIPAAVLCD